MELYMVFILFFGLTARQTDAACTFPVYLDGTWESSDVGTLEFNSSTVGIITVGSFGSYWFECYQQSGTKYVARSTATKNVLGQDKYFYMCFDLRYQSDNKYTYYLNTGQESAASNQRVKILDSSLTPSVSDICDFTLDVGSYRVLLKNDTISTEKVICPSYLLSTFNYTGPSCPQTFADACTDNTKISFNYTLCSTKVMYTQYGEVNCLYYTSSGSYAYLTVYNLDASTDESSYYRFTCIVSQVNGGIVTAGPYGKYCTQGATPGGASSTHDLHLDTMCPLPIVTTTPRSSAYHVTAGVTVLLMLSITFC